MDIDYKGQSYSIDQIVEILNNWAGEEHYSSEMLTVLTCGLKNPALLPKPKSKKITIDNLPDYCRFWVDKYLSGIRNRPSQRTGNPPSTIPDSLLAYIFEQKHPAMPIPKVEFALVSHSKMMTIETIVGDLLEEFLSVQLKDTGWCCCWGTTIKAVDFCHKNGRLLQVKTSDNSENSSSSDIRTGTTIEKWARRKSRKKNEYYWDDLQDITQMKNLTETLFREFVKKVLQDNPKCIHIQND